MALTEFERFIESVLPTLTADQLETLLEAIGKRIDELETTTPEARAIRSAIRAARGRSSRVPSSGKAKAICAIRAGMREARG